jgi:hypothetical protein
VIDVGFLKETMFCCPFCQKQTIKVLEKPSYRGFKTSRGSGVSNTYSVNVKGEYQVLTGCTACGKGLKEVEKGLFG